MTAIQKANREQILMAESDAGVKTIYERLCGTPQRDMTKQEMVIAIVAVEGVLNKAQTKTKEEVKPAPKLFTLAEFQEELRPLIDRGLKVTMDGENWTIQNGAACDSGHASVPLGLIKEIAGGIMRSRLPAKIKIDGEEVLA